MLVEAIQLVIERYCENKSAGIKCRKMQQTVFFCNLLKVQIEI